MKRPLKFLALWNSEYIGSDPKLFASQVGSGSVSKTQRKMWAGSEKNSFGSTTLGSGVFLF
jgi:hypothetical protein